MPDPTQPAQSLPDVLEGNILLVYTRFSGPQAASGVPLQAARVENILGRLFIVGIVPQETNDWAAGLKTCLAWDEVAHFVLFPSLHEYRVRVAAAPFIVQPPSPAQ